MKSIERYIEKFNVAQNEDLAFVERFPLEIFFPITDSEIPGIREGYYISNYSRVYSSISKKFLKMKVGSTGYYEFTVPCRHYNHNQKSVTLHRVLMMTFSPLDDYTGMVVNHIDGNKLNSFLYNLEWTDFKGNAIHASQHNLLHPAHGENHCCAKITANQAEQICQYLESRRYNYNDIAKRVGTTRGIVESIKQGKSWKDISCNYNLNFKADRMSRVFTFDDIHNICKYFQNNPKSDTMSIRQYIIMCLNDVNVPISASNINALRKIYKKERWKFICNNYNY